MDLAGHTVGNGKGHPACVPGPKHSRDAASMLPSSCHRHVRSTASPAACKAAETAGETLPHGPPADPDVFPVQPACEIRLEAPLS